MQCKKVIEPMRGVHACTRDHMLQETTYSMRLWTNGWDFFAPNENLIFHHYLRKGSPKFW